MTAYRYVRTGRLPATSVAGVWRIERGALDAMASASSSPKSPPMVGEVPLQSHAHLAEQLEDRLIDGDAEGSYSICQQALVSWARPADLYSSLLVPAMSNIGARWRTGELSVADEHRATAAVIRVMGRLGPHFSHPGRRKGTVVVGAPAGELHGLPVAMFSDLLRDAGLVVIDLGANTPPEAFVEAAQRSDRLRAVAIGATTEENEFAIACTVTALHEALPGVPVVVGGAGIPSVEVSRRLGADLWPGPDVQVAVRGIVELAEADAPGAA